MGGLDLAMDMVDKLADGSPKATVKFSTKSEADATAVRATINKTLEPVMEIITMMGVNVNIGGDGTAVEISVSPPREQVDMMIESIGEGSCDEDGFKALAGLIKALKNSKVQLAFANAFDDILASPDKPLPTVCAGAKLNAEIYASAEGKRILLKGLPKQSNKYCQCLIAWLQLFAGAEITTMYGFHQKNLEAAMKVVPEPMQPMLTIEGLKEFLLAQAPMMVMMIPPLKDPEMLPFMSGGCQCLDKLESIDSITVENVNLPARFAGSDAALGIKLSLNNVKPFGVIKYFLDPVLELPVEDLPGGSLKAFMASNEASNEA